MITGNSCEILTMNLLITTWECHMKSYRQWSLKHGVMMIETVFVHYN